MFGVKNCSGVLCSVVNGVVKFLTGVVTSLEATGCVVDCGVTVVLDDVVGGVDDVVGGVDDVVGGVGDCVGVIAVGDVQSCWTELSMSMSMSLSLSTNVSEWARVLGVGEDCGSVIIFDFSSSNILCNAEEASRVFGEKGKIL